MVGKEYQLLPTSDRAVSAFSYNSELKKQPTKELLTNQSVMRQKNIRQQNGLKSFFIAVGLGREEGEEIIKALCLFL